jgi:hypothetical protein
MVGIAQWLKTEIYDANASAEAEAALNALRDQLMAARKSEGEAVTTESGAAIPTPPDPHAAWQQYRQKRQELEQQYPNLDAIERGMRFKRRFFLDKNKQPCEGGLLCGQQRPLTPRRNRRAVLGARRGGFARSDKTLVLVAFRTRGHRPGNPRRFCARPDGLDPGHRDLRQRGGKQVLEQHHQR